MSYMPLGQLGPRLYIDDVEQECPNIAVALALASPETRLLCGRALANEYSRSKLLRQWERWRGAWRSPPCLSAQLLSNAPRIGFYNRRVKG